MKVKKLNFVLIGILILLSIGLLAGVWEANRLLEGQSVRLVALKAQNDATAVQQDQLTQDKKDIAAYSSLNTIAESVVPQDKDQAEAVREIVNLASQSGISQLSSIVFPASSLSGTGTGSSSGLTQVTPVKGIPGVYDLQITIGQDSNNPVPYSSFAAFLAKLEQNRRTAQVTSINIEPDQKNSNLIAFTLIIDEFIKP